MRHFAILAAFVALGSAQDIDFEGVKAAANPTYTIIPGLQSQVITYNSASAISSVRAEASASPLPDIHDDSEDDSSNSERRIKIRGASNARVEARAACDSQPTTPNIYNATLSPSDAFANDANLAQVAQNARTPAGYAQTYSNLGGSASANGYMGYDMIASYDTELCAAHCNRTAGCASFNIFFERNPVVEPGFQTCKDPAAFANIKCTYWGGPVTPEEATNVGQWRSDFHVVIAGSNGYVLTATPAVYGYTPASPMQTRAINSPLDCNNHGSYMGYRLFNDGGPFDPNLCQAACEAQNSYALAHPPSTGHPDLCKFYNTYLLAMNGVNQGQYCAMYTQYWDPAVYGTNIGQYDGQGNFFSIQYSFTYYNSSDPGLPICPADVESARPSAGPFCTSYNSYSAPTTTVTAGVFATATNSCGSIVGVSSSTSTPGPAVTPQPVSRRQDDGDDSDDDDSGDLVVQEIVKVIYPSKSANPESPGVPTSVTVYQAPTSSDDSSVTPTPSATDLQKRDPTPSAFAGHSAYEISSACSEIATGTVTVTTTTTSSTTTTVACAATPSTYTCNGANPTTRALFGSLTGSNTVAVDDSTAQVTLPFAVGVYNTFSPNVYVSSNGIIGINYNNAAYSNSPFPAFGAAGVVAPYWDDLYLFSGYPQYVSVSTCGNVGQRTAVFEWQVSHFSQSSANYHFTATFYEASPGVVTFHYISSSDQGSSATIGIQGNGFSSQYSYNSVSLVNGRTITFRTNSYSGSYSVSG